MQFNLQAEMEYKNAMRLTEVERTLDKMHVDVCIACSRIAVTSTCVYIVRDLKSFHA